MTSGSSLCHASFLFSSVFAPELRFRRLVFSLQYPVGAFLTRAQGFALLFYDCHQLLGLISLAQLKEKLRDLSLLFGPVYLIIPTN